MPSDLHLVAVDAQTLRDLAADRPDWAAGVSAGVGVRPTEWPPQDRRMLRYRLEALDDDPACAPYLLHLVLDDGGTLLGRIGCHAGPDEHGHVEIGYFVRPDCRGRGVAGRAVDLFLTWLAGRGVTSVRATVGPDNAASRRVLERRGFVETGTQIDEEDGLELVYSRRLAPDGGPS